jgi:hypothetical protein
MDLLPCLHEHPINLARETFRLAVRLYSFPLPRKLPPVYSSLLPHSTSTYHIQDPANGKFEWLSSLFPSSFPFLFEFCLSSSYLGQSNIGLALVDLAALSETPPIWLFILLVASPVFLRKSSR